MQSRPGSSLERYNNAFIAEAKAFTDAVLNDTDTLVTGFDGLQPVKIAMAANLSMKEGRPVKLRRNRVIYPSHYHKQREELEGEPPHRRRLPFS